jgi:hypothetical protein
MNNNDVADDHRSSSLRRRCFLHHDEVVTDIFCLTCQRFVCVRCVGSSSSGSECYHHRRMMKDELMTNLRRELETVKETTADEISRCEQQLALATRAVETAREVIVIIFSLLPRTRILR